MPAIVLDLQKRFKLTITDGLPQAVVETDNDGIWVRCCPLCGCIHKLKASSHDTPYTPLCQTLPAMFKTQQSSWQKLHPDVAKYSTLNLV